MSALNKYIVSICNAAATVTAIKYIVIILGGRGGSRTHERLSPLSVFETDALGHYATLPIYIL